MIIVIVIIIIIIINIIVIVIVIIIVIVISWSSFEQRVERWRRGWAANLGTETTPTQRRSLFCHRHFCSFLHHDDR